MGNINDYGLPQMKRILIDTSNTSDAIYLALLRQAILDVDSKIGTGVTITVTGSSYALAPAPSATSAIWNVYTYRAVLLYRKNTWITFLADMEGLSSIRDEVTTMSRGETMKQLRAVAEEAKADYQMALSEYRRGATDTIATMDTIAIREDDPNN